MYNEIAIYSETLDDQEKARIALENRIRSMSEKDLIDAALNSLLDQIKGLEKEAEKALTKHLKTLPLYAWIKGQVGLGEKQMGRLLGVIGDPSQKLLYDDDGNLTGTEGRTIAQLRSYCGMGDAEKQVRRKGQQGNWNSKARSRIWLIANSCIKQMHSPYRVVYDEARAQYKNAVHDKLCSRCGPSGKPAQAGSSLSDGHQHARAIRAVAKRILKDMWIEASST